MQISSQMANAKNALDLATVACHSVTQGPRGTWQEHLFLTPQSSPWGANLPPPTPQNRLPRSWMELLISAANAEVTDGFCTLGKRRGGRWVGGGWPCREPRGRHPARGWAGRRDTLPRPPPELPPSQEASARGGSPSVCVEQGQRGWDYGASPLVPVCSWFSVPGPACSAPPLLCCLGNRLFHWAWLWERWRSMLSDRALWPVKRAHSRKSGSTM